MGNKVSALREREQVLRNEICSKKPLQFYSKYLGVLTRETAYASMLYPPGGPFSILISGAPEFKRETHYNSHRYSLETEKSSLYTRVYSARLMRIEPRAQRPTTIHIEGGSDCKSSKFETCGESLFNKTGGDVELERIEFDRQVTLFEMRSEYSADHVGDMRSEVPTWAKVELLEELLHEVEAKMLGVFGNGYKNLVWESVNNTKDPKDKHVCGDDEGLETEHDGSNDSLSSSTPFSESDVLYDHEQIEDTVLL
ncbi:hypothetical protein SLS56_001056 [Neofusicoccum ribis]|uniref:Uncharacterized protein n=1 Tax=Neofusicoccum ribis TaxID=45134 RepID=A0ABR3TA99_9PEZI